MAVRPPKKNVSIPTGCRKFSGEPDKIQKSGIVNSDTFKQACLKAGVEPTKRQASKYLSKRGAAYAARVKTKNK